MISMIRPKTVKKIAGRAKTVAKRIGNTRRVKSIRRSISNRIRRIRRVRRTK